MTNILPLSNKVWETFINHGFKGSLIGRNHDKLYKVINENYTNMWTIRVCQPITKHDIKVLNGTKELYVRGICDPSFITPIIPSFNDTITFLALVDAELTSFVKWPSQLTILILKGVTFRKRCPQFPDTLEQLKIDNCYFHTKYWLREGDILKETGLPSLPSSLKVFGYAYTYDCLPMLPYGVLVLRLVGLPKKVFDWKFPSSVQMLQCFDLLELEMHTPDSINDLYISSCTNLLTLTVSTFKCVIIDCPNLRSLTRVTNKLEEKVYTKTVLHNCYSLTSFQGKNGVIGTVLDIIGSPWFCPNSAVLNKLKVAQRWIRKRNFWRRIPRLRLLRPYLPLSISLTVLKNTDDLIGLLPF